MHRRTHTQSTHAHAHASMWSTGMRGCMSLVRMDVSFYEYGAACAHTRTRVRVESQTTRSPTNVHARTHRRIHARGRVRARTHAQYSPISIVPHARRRRQTHSLAGSQVHTHTHTHAHANAHAQAHAHTHARTHAPTHPRALPHLSSHARTHAHRCGWTHVVRMVACICVWVCARVRTHARAGQPN